MKHRLQFAARKLVRMALLLLGVSLVAFLLMSASPLDPLQTNIGQTALGSMSAEQIERRTCPRRRGRQDFGKKVKTRLYSIQKGDQKYAGKIS